MHRLNGTRLQAERHTDGLAVEDYFQTLSQVIPRLPYSTINLAAAAILRAFEEGRTVFVFGNGGSAATASHIACDLNKGTSEKAQSRRIKVMSLTDNVPLMTAWANDVSYEHVFSEQLKNFVQARDVVFAISASGNSPNVLRALETAREACAIAIGISGFQGGRMKDLCDLCAIVPSDNMQMIEDLHHAIAHSIFTAVRDQLRLQGTMFAAVCNEEKAA
ncbi:MAG: sugar isomerase [Acidobacteriaceae bacterium]|nr:sugar isomerase [Acidobacteriaceae bacterium]